MEWLKPSETLCFPSLQRDLRLLFNQPVKAFSLMHVVFPLFHAKQTFKELSGVIYLLPVGFVSIVGAQETLSIHSSYQHLAPDLKEEGLKQCVCIYICIYIHTHYFLKNIRLCLQMQHVLQVQEAFSQWSGNGNVIPLHFFQAVLNSSLKGLWALFIILMHEIGPDCW